MRTRTKCLALLGAVFWTSAAAAVPQRVLRQILIDGNKALPTPLLMGRIPLKPGAALLEERVKLSLNVIKSLYQDRGYYRVEVSSETVAFHENQVDLYFHIQEGDLYTIGTLTIQGNRNVSNHIILRDLGLHTGDVFSQSKIFEGNRQLYMSGYFESVDFSYSTSAAHAVDVAIHIKEKATRYLKGGFGYGTATKESLTLGYEDLNFLGNARKLDVSATHSGFLTNPSHYRTTLLQTNLTQPHLFDSAYEGQVNVSREYDNREAYDSNSTASHLSLGRRYSSAITASLRYRYQGTHVTRVSPAAGTPSFTNISAFGPRFTYDNTNDPFLPTIGWRVIGAYEEGVRFFAGDVRFHKLESRVGRFDRLFGDWVTFEGLQGGQILPDSSSSNDVIPIYERYFLGGANTVRGYNERELGPRDSKGVPLGGNAFLVGNVEVRHPLYKKLWAVVFLDGGQLYPTGLGQTWPQAQMKSLNDFRYGTGFGLRLNSPVGAVRLEFGYKLNPPGGSGFLDRSAIHFSIGEVF